MRRISLRSKVLLAGVLVLAAAGGVLAVLQRHTLLAWYTVRGLAQAGEADREGWVEQVIALDEAGAAALLQALRQDNAPACANTGVGLAALGRHWSGDEARWGSLAARLAEALPRCSSAGQQAILEVFDAWLKPGERDPRPPAAVTTAAAVALDRGVSAGSEVRARGLAVAETLLERGCPAELLAACRNLVQGCLRDPSAPVRAWAVRLAAHPVLGLLEPAMALLRDPAADVRREAMLAARLASEAVVKTDDLLHWLHDSDEDVRRLCESVLTLRGMTREQVKLGRLLTHRDHTVRLRVLDALDDPDLEPGVWLRLLSADPEPAVRVAAVRYASDHASVDFADRLDQMADSDPSPTVRQLVRGYLTLSHPLKGPASRP